MAKLRRIDSAATAVAPDSTVKLEVSPFKAGNTVKWTHGSDEITEAKDKESHEFKADKQTVGRYTATVDGDAAVAEIELTMAEPKPTYFPEFARNALLVIGPVSAVVLLVGAWRVIDKSGGDWSATGGNLMFAAALTLPVIVLGGLALATGLFMAAVEWRGRFKEKTDEFTDETVTGLPDKIAEIITAVGKLQGATLVLVVGTLLLLGSIWGVASSAAGTAPSASPSPSPSPTATTSTGSTGPTGP